MNCRRLTLIISVVWAPFCASAAAVTIQTSPVGYAGNATDPATGSLYGAVPYIYNIGTFDVTSAQYAEFLNAKAATSDPYELWAPVMAPSQNSGVGGIVRTGSGFGPYSYSVQAGYANKPAVGVSWYDAVRFVNWMQNGQGGGDTESGTYTITGGGHQSGTVTVPSAAQRATWAAAGQFHWLLPSENEWYKAAYYNGNTNTYYAYPFQSNTQPTAAAPSGAPDTGDFALTLGTPPAYNSDGFNSDLTDVGSYTNSLSPFGSYDMGGDLQQWNDTDILGDGSERGLRGGDWVNGSGSSSSVSRAGASPFDDFSADVGFRLASVGVPEPASIWLLICGVLGMGWVARCRTC